MLVGKPQQIWLAPLILQQGRQPQPANHCQALPRCQARVVVAISHEETMVLSGPTKAEAITVVSHRNK